MEPRHESEYQQAQEAKSLEAEKTVVCILCVGDVLERRVTRHTKNILRKRRKSVSEQTDAVQCEMLGGGLGVTR